MSRLIIENGRVLDPSQGLDAPRTVVIEDGRIVELREGPPQDQRAEKPGAAEGVPVVIDAQGAWVAPGFIDLHVHLREPGEEHKETVETGARAAVAGGFTAVVAMPNTRPPIDNAGLVRFVRERADAAGLARVHVAGCVSKGQKGEELAELGDMRDAGAVAFTDDGRPVMDAALMRRALEYCLALGVPVMVHAEDLRLSHRGVMNEGPTATRLGLRGIPAEAESVMVARDVEIAEMTGGRLHVAHVSTARAVQLIREGKSRGVSVTAEAAPHHFTLTDAAVEGYDTNARMNPPLRADADREAVRAGLRDGTLDAIATDHAPHALEDKACEFDAAANGVVGLETALPLALALELPPLRLVELLSTGPARAFALPGGSLKPGSPADVTIFDPAAEWTVDPARFRSKSRNTPFAGWKVRGRVRATVVGGRVVFRGA
jgi:dihydroorotase